MARTPPAPNIRIDEILDVAEPLFSANGYRKTTIRDIAKKMGVAQEAILEALIKREISSLLTDVKSIVSSADIIPPRKIEIMIQAVFKVAQHEDGLFLDFLSAEKNWHLKNKVFRQTTLLLRPWLLKIIGEGVLRRFFYVPHIQTVANFIISILLCLGDALCEKSSEEIMVYHLNMAGSLIEKVLGMPKNTLHLTLFTPRPQA